MWRLSSAERVILEVLDRLDRPTVDELTVAARREMRLGGETYIRTYHLDEHVDALLADGTLRLRDGGRVERRRPVAGTLAEAPLRRFATFYSTDFRGAWHMDMRRAGA